MNYAVRPLSHWRPPHASGKVPRFFEGSQLGAWLDVWAIGAVRWAATWSERNRVLSLHPPVRQACGWWSLCSVDTIWSSGAVREEWRAAALVISQGTLKRFPRLTHSKLTRSSVCSWEWRHTLCAAHCLQDIPRAEDISHLILGRSLEGSQKDSVILYYPWHLEQALGVSGSEKLSLLRRIKKVTWVRSSCDV